MMIIKPEMKNYDQVMNSMISGANAVAEECHDFTISEADNTYMHIDQDGLHSKDHGFYKLTDWALNQFCSKIGFYRKQYDKFQELGMDYMNYDCMNKLIARCPRDYFMRTYQDKLRAVLTPRYEVFDTPQILDVIDEGLHQFTNTDNLLVQGYYQDFEQFHARITVNEPITGVYDKDLYTGLTVDTSDVGGSALHIRYFIYKKVCTNGMVLPLFDNEVVRCDHKGTMGVNVLTKVKYAISALKDSDIKAKAIIERASKPQKFDFEESQKLIMRDFQLGLKEYEKVVSLVPHYSNSAWGLANAITEVAQDTEDFTRRLRLERLAGEFVTKAPFRYRQIA